MRSAPFPFEAVRDLVGILRALYAATPAKHAERRRAIVTVAGELRKAVEMARKHGPGTLGHASAWQRAERATKDLGDLVEVLALLEPVLLVAGQRVRGKR